MSRRGAYIEKVIVEGFKSYGSKRKEIPLGQGFVAIVGPNGSGKSNIGDAISFALGLASSKVLRAKNLSYLIWSKGDKKADHAYVEVHFKNEGAFPLKEETVIFSRKVFPNGRSVFKINGKTVKERDVKELLTRAGITENAYNVVLQGDIIHFLKMTPLQRRRLIEEIAGIGEFDEKKEKALLELGEVELKLKELKLRIEELERQRETLRKDVERLRLYRELKEKERELNVKLTLKKLAALNRKSEEIETQLKEIQTAWESLEGERSEKLSRLEEIEGELQKVEELLSPYRERTGKIEAQREFLLKELENLKREKDKLENFLSEIPERKEKLKKELEEAAVLEEEIEKEISLLREREAEKRRELEKVEKEIASVEARLGNAVEELKRVEERLKKISSEKREREEKLHSLLRELDSLDLKVERTSENLRELEGQKREILASFLGNISYEREKFKKIIEEKERVVNSLREKLERIDRRLVEDAKRREELLKEITRLEAQRESSGNETVEFLKRNVEGVYGTVAELIKVKDEEFLIPVEVAGGNRLRYVVVEDENVAKECISLLKKHSLGRLTFIPLNRIRAPRVDYLPRTVGVVDFVYRLLDYDPAVEKAILYVFGDTILVEDYEAAKRLGIGVYRMVTLEGELFEKGGTITGGTYKSANLLKGGFIEAKLSELKEELTSLERKTEKLKKEREKLKERLWSEEGSLNYAKRKLKELEGDHSSALGRLKSIEERIKKGEEYLRYLKGELEKKEKLAERLQEEITDLEGEMEELSKRKEELLKLLSLSGVEELKVRRDGILKEIENLLKKISQKEKELLKLETAHRSLSEELEKLELQSEETERKVGQLSEKVKQTQRRLSELQEEYRSLGEKIRLLLEKRENLKDRREDIKRELAVLEAKLEGLASEKERVLTEKAKLESERELLLKEIPKETKPTEVGESIQTLKGELKKIQNRLSELGNINFRSEEELKEVEERYLELNEKHRTLQREKKALTDFISEIERKKTKIFLETFEAVNKNLKEIFSFLSPGGKARMELEKPHDPLSGGINMVVKPRGKEVKFLEAMSGGEKTLAALSLIFALQRFKPAPFYYFDEVDAHLDEANAVRVGELIKRYSEEAQFIVVTLRESVAYLADRLIGVTSKGGLSEVYFLDPATLEKV